jgi:hypothetical protein
MLVHHMQSTVKTVNAQPLGERLKQLTTFGRLDYDSDNDVLKRDFTFGFASHIDKCIKVAQRPDELEECPDVVNLDLNGLT